MPQQVNIHAIMEREVRWNEDAEQRAQSNTLQSFIEHVRLPVTHNARLKARSEQSLNADAYAHKTKLVTDVSRESVVCRVDLQYM